MEVSFAVQRISFGSSLAKGTVEVGLAAEDTEVASEFMLEIGVTVKEAASELEVALLDKGAALVREAMSTAQITEVLRENMLKLNDVGRIWVRFCTAVHRRKLQAFIRVLPSPLLGSKLCDEV